MSSANKPRSAVGFLGWRHSWRPDPSNSTEAAKWSIGLRARKFGQRQRAELREERHVLDGLEPMEVVEPPLAAELKRRRIAKNLVWIRSAELSAGIFVIVLQLQGQFIVDQQARKKGIRVRPLRVRIDR